MSERVLKSGSWYFIDTLLIAIGGWFFWILLANLIDPNEIGIAVQIISLVYLVGGVAMLGLEYPLLKRINSEKKVFGSLLLIEIFALLSSTIPVIVWFLYFPEYLSVENFVISIALLFGSGLSFISRFAILGKLNVKTVVLVDLGGTVIKFISFFLFFSYGLNIQAILFATMMQQILPAIIFTALAIRNFGIIIETLKYIKGLFKEAISNFPSKMSKIIIQSLSIVLMGLFGVSLENISFFYIAMQISLVVASFAMSLAIIALPISNIKNQDLSESTYRLSLLISSPIIAVIITIPSTLLSAINSSYSAASEALLILGIAIVPFVAVMSVITKLNYTNSFKKLTLLGIIEISIFLISFFTFGINNDIVGIAWSIFAAYLVTGIISMIWLGRHSLRYLGISSLSILIGYGTGITLLAINVNEIIVAIIIPLVSFSIIIVLKGLSVKELSSTIRSFMK